MPSYAERVFCPIISFTIRRFTISASARRLSNAFQLAFNSSSSISFGSFNC